MGFRGLALKIYLEWSFLERDCRACLLYSILRAAGHVELTRGENRHKRKL